MDKREKFDFSFVIGRNAFHFNNCKEISVMCTVLVSYKPSNKMAVQAMNLLSMIKGIEIEDSIWATEAEIKRYEKSRKSGICTDIDKLQNKLKAIYEN